MKLSRVKKLTWKLLLSFSFAIALVALADRRPDKWLAWNFWAGLGPVLFAIWIRLWAAGHLVKNKVLTVTGPYAYVKNPLYIGTFFGVAGFALMAMGDPRDPWFLRYANWMILGGGVLSFLFYYIPYKKKREGDRLREIFGTDWDHYDQAVPDYLPKVRRYERAGDARWSWKAACENSEQWTAPAIAIGIAALIANGWMLDQVDKLIR